MSNLKTSHRLIIFITVSLLLQILLIVLKSRNLGMHTTLTKAQEVNCPYPNGIAPVGSHIAGNNNPDNYAQLRQLYNTQNPSSTGIQNCYIPVTVMYDLFFLKGDPAGIQNNLQAMKNNGLYPIIRVATYTSGNNWIKLYPPTDAKIMGEHLGQALNNIHFPQAPIITYLNEVNLNDEWAGAANPEEFAESFNAFYQGLSSGNNFALFFPPLSYGADGQNGIAPQEFISRFFASNKFNGKISGVALNIYGSDYTDISNQYSSQLSSFGSNTSQIPTVITELGPIRNGAAVENCETAQSDWQNASADIINGIIAYKLTIAATMGCFGSVTYPAIIHYDGTVPQLVKLNNTSGQIENKAENNNTKTANNTTNNNQTGGDVINFEPANPQSNTDFSIITQSNTAYGNVYLQIFKKTDEKNAVWKAADNVKDEPTVKSNKPYSWTYHLSKGQPKVLSDGEYTVIFYSDCKNMGGVACQERKRRTLSLGTGKTNDIQTVNQQTTQQQIQTQNNQTQNQQTKVTMDKTSQRCFDVSANINPTNADGGINFDFTVTVTMTGRRDGHIQLFSSKDPDKDIIAYANGSHPVIIDKTVYPDQITWRSTPDASVFVAKNQTTSYGFRVKIDECNELGNMDWVSCKLSVDANGNPSVSGTNCSMNGEAAVQDTQPINISSPGKITLDLSLIDKIDPNALEYCDRPQTSNAGCTNPHDQDVENGKVTMSFPDGHPAIFCGSIPVNRRSEANGSDRECVVLYQNI